MTLGDYVNKLRNLLLAIVFFMPHPKAFEQELVIPQVLKWLVCCLSSLKKYCSISRGREMPRTPPCRDFFSILPPQAPIPLICKSMSPPLMYIGDPQLFVWSCLLVLMTTTCKTQQISWWSLLGNAELLHEAPGCFFEGPSTQSWGSIVLSGWVLYGWDWGAQSHQCCLFVF